MALCSSLTAGCLTVQKPPPMSPDMPIEIDTSFGQPRYKQNGHAIEAVSMRDELRKNPEASSAVDGSVAAAVIGIVLAAGGGAMIGIPAGMAAGGDQHPPWALAGAGAGLAVGGIVLAACAPLILDRAVKEHNKHFQAPAAQGLVLPQAPATAGVPLPGPRRTVQTWVQGPDVTAVR